LSFWPTHNVIYRRFLKYKTLSQCAQFLDTDRCYDFKNIFAKNIGEIFVALDAKNCWILQKVDHNISF
jgi:hypothetical protein